MVLNLNKFDLIPALVAILVLLLLGWYTYFSKRKVQDQQDQRSLHQGQAITGGGVWMFVPFCAGGLWLYPLFIPLYVVLLLSILGFIDDRVELSFKLRLALQVVAAVLTLVAVGLDDSAVVFLFLIFCLLWWINLFNFMDGANGMAGLHGLVSVGFYGWLFSLHFSQDTVLSYLALTGVLVLVVYLLFNLILNKLFMGDSGSLPLAWLIAVLALYALNYGVLTMVQIATIHAVFIVDATFTLLNRMRLKENITEAHATHTYQRLIKTGRSHTMVSLLYGLITLMCCVMVWLTLGADPVVQYATWMGVYGLLAIIFMKYLNLGR